MVVLVGGQRLLKVDAHTHLLPQSWSEEFDIPLRLVRYDVPSERGFAARLEYKSDGRLFRELKPNCFDVNVVLAECDSYGVDVQVCCTVPVMFNYQLPPSAGVGWSKFLNDDIAKTCNLNPERLIALGTLPLQDTAAAVEEVGRCLALGIVGFQVGSHVNAYRGVNADGTPKIEMLAMNHPDLRPVWRECERLGACIMIHPWDMEWWCPGEYWQPWLVGMPTETTLAGTALMLGGVLTECPGLKFMMSHGGGALPYLMGRIEWGYRCRPDLVAKDCPEMPREVLKRFYFDSITHDEHMLQHLVALCGPEKVMLGSDYPFPLGEVASIAPVTGEKLTAYPGELIQSSRLTVDQKRMLLSGTALEWMGLTSTAERFMARVKDMRIPAQAADGDQSNGKHGSALPSHLPIYVVDAFTDKPYAGNPAAVVLVPAEVDAHLTDAHRRLIAAQMNLSETAFVCPSSEGGSHVTASRFGLRWFTPDGTEVNLCGHATLATAKALIAAGNLSGTLTFDTLSGPLVVAQAASTSSNSSSSSSSSSRETGLCMTLPKNPPCSLEQCSQDVRTAVAALQVVVQKAVGGMEAIDVEYSAATKKLLVRLPDESAGHEAGQASSLSGLLAISAEFPSLLRAAHGGAVVRGVMVTLRTPAGPYDFQSRYFAPWVGIPEDPVTGSAHTVLGPYYQRILNKCELSARQCSPRGGDLHLQITADSVLVTGRAAVVLRGEVAMPVA
jgi:aminocarboxymuconate-semialdehyde decarboxylase